MITTKRAGDELLVEMVELVRETTSETMPTADTRGLARLEQALHQRAVPSRTRGLRLIAAVATATIVAGTGGTLLYRQVGAVTYQVRNGAVDEGGFVRPTAPGTAVVFSEGSQVTLGAAARTRVQDLTTAGGRVIVESGSVHARIVPRKRARWFVDAGPYTIRVTGTAFDVKWSWADESLDIAMERGSVIVTGPLAPSGVTLTAGMRLIANPRAGLQIGGATRGTTPSAPSRIDGPAEAPPETAMRGSGPAAEPLAPDMAVSPLAGLSDPARQELRQDGRGKAADRLLGKNGATGASAGRAAVRVTTVERRVALLSGPGPTGASNRGGGTGPLAGTWERQLARGDVQAILDEAEAAGIDAVLGNASGRELAALADAARYGHRSVLARRALLSLRERFPRSPESRDAAFFLGALAEDAVGAGGPSAALGWYDRYLQENAGGPYAAQALGRKMVMTQKLRGSDAARPVADEYLERFPGGPYASSARKLMRAP